MLLMLIECWPHYYSHCHYLYCSVVVVVVVSRVCAVALRHECVPSDLPAATIARFLFVAPFGVDATSTTRSNMRLLPLQWTATPSWQSMMIWTMMMMTTACLLFVPLVCTYTTSMIECSALQCRVKLFRHGGAALCGWFSLVDSPHRHSLLVFISVMMGLRKWVTLVTN
jgi:hypothetical protein